MVAGQTWAGTFMAPWQWGHFTAHPARLSGIVSAELQVGQAKGMDTTAVGPETPPREAIPFCEMSRQREARKDSTRARSDLSFSSRSPKMRKPAAIRATQKPKPTSAKPTDVD